MRPELRLQPRGSNSDVTNEAATIERRIMRVYGDFGEGWRAPEGVKRSLQEVWRERTNQKRWGGGGGPSSGEGTAYIHRVVTTLCMLFDR